jgi:hypothetical protein
MAVYLTFAAFDCVWFSDHRTLQWRNVCFGEHHTGPVVASHGLLYLGRGACSNPQKRSVVYLLASTGTQGIAS